MAGTNNCLSKIDLGSKRKYEEGNTDAKLQKSDVLEKPPAECDSDSDEGYACEAPDTDGNSFKALKHVASSASCERQRADMGPFLKQRRINEKAIVTASLRSSTQPPSATTSAKDLASSVVSANIPVHQTGVKGTRDDSHAKNAAQVKNGAVMTISTITTSRPSERKRVWVCGHSFVRRAVQGLTDLRDRNLNLKNTNVDWVWVDDMRWSQLRNGVLQKVMADGKPDVLVIHLGGNELPEFGWGPLLHHMKDTLMKLVRDLGETAIVWSEIIARPFWSGMVYEEVEVARRIVNNEMERYTKEMGFGFIHHDQISWNPENFAGDGVHLSDVGIVIMRQGILKALQALGCN